MASSISSEIRINIFSIPSIPKAAILAIEHIISFDMSFEAVLIFSSIYIPLFNDDVRHDPEVFQG